MSDEEREDFRVRSTDLWNNLLIFDWFYRIVARLRMAGVAVAEAERTLVGLVCDATFACA